MEAGFDEFSETNVTLFSRFNVSPSQTIPVVALHGGKRVIRPGRWGFIPVWSREGDPKIQPINAKSETVRTSGMFRSAFKGGRCLLPGDGFFEWKADTKPKQPTFFHRGDDAVWAFAGLSGRDDTCLLCTTTPNVIVAPIHNRMPVILHPKDFGTWLDPDADPDELQSLLRPYPDDELVGTAVSTRVNSPKCDDASLIDPEGHGE
jgi:putative SOS response-associated peptidase YedK